MELLQRFHSEWFNHPEWWFSKSEEYDKYISCTYVDLLDVVEQHCHTPIQQVLVYDQLPRHIYRNQQANHIILYFLEKALNIVHQQTIYNYHQSLTAVEWTFFMLPLRHTQNVLSIKKVIKETWERIENKDNDIQIYKRFLKATYKKFLNSHKNQSQLIKLHQPRNTCIDKETFTSILYFSPIDYIIPTTSQKSDIRFNGDIIDPQRRIIISLSGGVDSMVSSFIIKQMFPTSDISALHICYDNRSECEKEILFLRHWCSHLNIPLYVRKLDEIHRQPCMEYELRELYENYTRDVRYNCYKSITSDKCPQVIIGHNGDDKTENIMTNIAHRNRYDNLFGMTSVSIQDDIMFLRPLLETSKEDIIKFAHQNSIPYLPNSTPVWSQRGQIRNTIMPVLDKWNDKFVPSLSYLSETMSCLYIIMQNSVRQFINQGTLCKENKIFSKEHVALSEVVNEDIFWKELFIQLFNIYVSSKSISNLVSVINQIKKSLKVSKNNENRKIMITKHIVLELIETNNKIFTFQIINDK